MNSNDVYYFERRYNAQVRSRQMTVRNPVPITWQDRLDSDIYDMKTITESVPAVEIVMTEDSFKELMALSDECNKQEYKQYQYLTSKMGQNWLANVLNQQDRNQQEHRLRSQNPALQKAWDQYQLMLRLVE